MLGGGCEAPQSRRWQGIGGPQGGAWAEKAQVLKSKTGAWGNSLPGRGIPHPDGVIARGARCVCSVDTDCYLALCGKVEGLCQDLRPGGLREGRRSRLQGQKRGGTRRQRDTRWERTRGGMGQAGHAGCRVAERRKSASGGCCCVRTVEFSFPPSDSEVLLWKVWGERGMQRRLTIVPWCPSRRQSLSPRRPRKNWESQARPRMSARRRRRLMMGSKSGMMTMVGDRISRGSCCLKMGARIWRSR